MGGWPFWAVIAGLFVVVMARSHLFYWVGRGVTSGAARLADRVPGADDASGGGDGDTGRGRRARPPGAVAESPVRASGTGVDQSPRTETRRGAARGQESAGLSTAPP
jgi:hypothetical protein